jgi:septal ring factor EnvC (AmiA/AmiB activator)
MFSFSAIQGQKTKTLQYLEVSIRNEEKKKETDPTWVALAETQQALDTALATREQARARREQAAAGYESALNAHKEQKKTPSLRFFSQVLGYSKEDCKARWDQARENVHLADAKVEPLQLHVHELMSHAARSDIAKKTKTYQKQLNDIETKCSDLCARLSRTVPHPDEIELKNSLLRFLETTTEADAMQLRELLSSYNPHHEKSYGFFSSFHMVHHDTVKSILTETMNLFPEMSQPQTHHVPMAFGVSSRSYHP